MCIRDRLGFEDRIRLLPGDGFEPVRGELFDLILSNPPYLSRREAPGLPPELAHEPREALFAEGEGTELLRRLASEARDLLEAGGALAVEVSPQQAPEMTEWLASAGFARVEGHFDLAGRVRVVSAGRGCVPRERGQGNGKPS